RYLQDQSVKVHLFDRDLQEIIQAENQKFVEQAEERAEAAQREPSRVVLSGFEAGLSATNIADLGTKALEAYATSAGIADKIGSPPFNRRMLQQGLLHELQGHLVPTG